MVKYDRQLYERSVDNYSSIETTMKSFFQNGGWNGTVPVAEVLALERRIEMLYPRIGIVEHRNHVKTWLHVCQEYLRHKKAKPANVELRQFVDDRGTKSKVITLDEYEALVD